VRPANELEEARRRFGPDLHTGWLLSVVDCLGPKAARPLVSGQLLTLEVSGWGLEVACGADFSIRSRVYWPHLPPDGFVVLAPLGSYSRAKWLESGLDPIVTGDMGFDNAYLVLGGQQARQTAAPQLTASIRRALLDAASLNVSIGLDAAPGVMSDTPYRRLRSHPDIRATPDSSLFVTIGQQRFTPEYCVVCVLAFVELLQRLGQPAAA